jgi:hypothetical protein
MVRLMRTILTLLALLFGSATAAPAEQEGGGTVDTGSFMDIQAQTINQVIDKAMRWQSEYPASVADNELMEVVEEVMFFYALHSAPGYEAERPYFLREITARDRTIKAYLAETSAMRDPLNGDWAALTYPPLVHILSQVGLETDAYRGLIDELISRKRHRAPARNAMRLWIAIYLARLGLMSDSVVQYLLNDSPLQQDPETHTLLDYFTDHPTGSRDHNAAIQIVYNITHEIIALTDFGALPPPPVMMVQHTHYAHLVDAAISWATRESALDVLAELVFCAHLLDLGELPALPAAIALIISKQQADGSFGITNPDRPNGVRHGVLTSLLALKTLDTSKLAADKR